jgi:TonB family protein
MVAARERLSPFIATSAALHGLLFAAIVFGPLLFPKREAPRWGTSTDKGVKVGVTSSLPGVALPTPPVVDDNAKGNESKTLHAAEPAPKETKKSVPKEADIKVPSGKKTDSKKVPEPPRAVRPPAPEPAQTVSNAIPGASTGQISLPYGSSAASTGGPATFGDGTFGTKFPDYVTNMIRAIKVQWQNSGLIPQQGTSPRVYIKFTIGRRGDVSNVEIDQVSGLPQLDNSAKTAVLRASLPPLPQGYSGSSVDVRFYFEYSR